MFRIIAYLGVNVLSLLALDHYLDNFAMDDWTSGLVFVLALTLVNWTVVPIIKLLAFPITFLTLGLFNLVINFAAVWFVADNIKGIEVTGVTGDKALTMAIIAVTTSVASHVARKLVEDNDD